MWTRAKSLTAVLIVSLFVPGALQAKAPAPEETKKEKPTPDEIAKAEKLVKDELADKNGQACNVLSMADDVLFQAFPKYLFFSAVYRQYPIAIAAPEGMKSANIFVVTRGKEAKPQLINEAKDLESLFKANLLPASDEERAKGAVRAWLTLSPVLRQDGFFAFKLMEDSTKVTPEKSGKKATGMTVVMRGGNGEMDATLAFDENGKLLTVTETAKIRPGPRPICQATKLLDKDPIVRRMAEQDLLIMGMAARDYLAEQRAKAPPELQQAIDEMCKRLQNEER